MISSCSELATYSYPSSTTFLEDNLLHEEDWGDKNSVSIADDGSLSPDSLYSPSSDFMDLEFISNYQPMNSLHYELDTFLQSSKLFLGDVEETSHIDNLITPSPSPSPSPPISPTISCFASASSPSTSPPSLSPSTSPPSISPSRSPSLSPSSLQRTVPQEPASPTLAVSNTTSMLFYKDPVISNPLPILPANPVTTISSTPLPVPTPVPLTKSPQNIPARKYKPILVKQESVVSRSCLQPAVYPLPIASPATIKPVPAIVQLDNGQQIYVAAVENCNQNTSPPSTTAPTMKAKQPKTSKKVEVAQVKPVDSMLSNMNNLRKYKREQRLAKNRESACLSRQRKKEYTAMLEVQVGELSKINEVLKSENEQLNQRIFDLEQELHGLRKSVETSNLKKTSVLFVFGFMFLLNFTSFLRPMVSPNSAMYRNPDKNVELLPYASELTTFHSRSLLNVDTVEDGIFLQPDKKSFNSNLMSDLDGLNSIYRRKKALLHTGRGAVDTSKSGSKYQKMAVDANDCGEHLNETYIKKINNALNGLVKGLGSNEKDVKNKTRSKRPPRKFGRGKILDAIVSNSTVGKMTRSKTDNCTHRKQQDRSTLLLKNFRLDKYRKFLSAEKDGLFNLTSQELANAIQKSIHRKSDTFYVVTSPKDFLTILPSTNHSNIRRPKVSFMIPVSQPSGNGTYSNGELKKLSLLKIDCKVLDTTLVQLDRHILFRSLITGL